MAPSPASARVARFAMAVNAGNSLTSPDHRQHGPGFVAFPLAGLLVTVRFHAVLGAQLDSSLASFRDYLPIGPRQAKEVVGMLWTAFSNYLNTESLLLGLLSLLTFSTLLGYMFARPSGQPDTSRASRLRWLVLPGGRARGTAR